MKDLFQKFLLKFNGMTKVGNTSENKSQCTGLVNIWVVDYLKKSFIWGNAKDFINNYNPLDFDVILNTPEAIPQVGDVIIWSQSYNGNYGHVGIATGTGDTNTFEAFEQNDPLGSNCHLKTYKYTSVLGWLRTRGNASDSQSIILAQSDAFIAICTKLNLPANRDVVLAELDKLIQMQDALVQKDKQLSEAQTKTIELEKTISDKQGELETLQENLRIIKEQTDQATEDNKILQSEIKQLKEGYLPVPVLTGWRKILYNLFFK